MATTASASPPRRQISLLGAVSILVGFVVGASIFILVGPLAGQVGPGLPLAYALACVPAVFACLYNVQLAGALPTTGANYVAGTRFISPAAGFVTTWMILVGACFGVPLLAVGFASYLAELVPGTPITLAAVAVVVLLGGANLLGLRFAAVVQVILVVLFMLALAIYVAGGIPQIDTARYSPPLPNGTSALLLAAIAAYYSFTGFTVITEVAGEVRDARRNVPRAIIISFLLVLAIYVGVTGVLTGTMDWQAAGESPAAVADSAATYLPDGVVTFISLGALFASATTINAVFTSLSRDVLQLGRDGVFPAWFGRTHEKSGSPYGGILTLTAVSVVGVLLAFGIERYALITVFAFLVIHLITATAVLRLPRLRPDLWERSPFQFTPFWRWFTYLGMVTLALGIFGYASYDDPVSGLVFLLCSAVAIPYWVMRRRTLLKRGIDLDDSMRRFTDDMSAELDLPSEAADGSGTEASTRL